MQGEKLPVLAKNEAKGAARGLHDGSDNQSHQALEVQLSGRLPVWLTEALGLANRG